MLSNIRLIFVFAHLFVVCLSEPSHFDNEDYDVFKEYFEEHKVYTTAKPSLLNLMVRASPHRVDSSSPCHHVRGQQQPTAAPCQFIPEQYKTTPKGCQATIEPITEVKYVGYEYSNETGHWYKFHAGPVVNWTDARQACIDDGGDLAVPNSEAEAKVIMGLHARYLNEEITDTEWPDWVSVGIFWEDNAWRTVDGQLLKDSGYTKWWKENPGTEYRYYTYVVMNRGGDLSVTRTVLYPYVCEKKTVRAEITINYY